MFRYDPEGVCCETIDIELDGTTIKQAKIYGGCDGNLNAICKLAEGRDAEEVASLLEGNTCHRHDDTSCADQLSHALRAAEDEASARQNCSASMSRRWFVKAFAAGAIATVLIGNPSEAFAESTRPFTDSLGRTVSVPGTIRAISPTGRIAQSLICTLCPETLASLSSEIDEEDIPSYVESNLASLINLPETGGSKSSDVGEVSIGSVENVAPDILIDAGLPKNGLSEELDSLQSKTGTPCVFIDLSFGKLPDAYRLLGSLLGRDDRAEELAAYVEMAMDKAASAGSSSKRSCSVFYAPRKHGLQVKSSYTVQANAIQYIGATPITSPYRFPDRTVDISAVNRSNTDLVIFDDRDCLEGLSDSDNEEWSGWRECSAVIRGNTAASPALFDSWFGSLFHVQSIGMLWLAGIIWPDTCPFDLATEACGYYKLFYGLDVPETDMSNLIGTYKENGYGHPDPQ